MDTIANTQQQARRHRAWRIARASVVFVWSVLVIFASLLWSMFQVLMRAIPDDEPEIEKSPYDNPTANNVTGGTYNGRTGFNDDGLDPHGLYDYDH